MRSDLNQSAEGAVTFLKAEVAPHDSMSELGKVPTKRLCFLSLYVFLSELCLINISGAIKRVKPNRKKLRNLLRPEIYPVESHIYLQVMVWSCSVSVVIGVLLGFFPLSVVNDC